MPAAAQKRKSETEQETAELIRKFLRTRANAKLLYDRADRLLVQISERMSAGESIAANASGKRYALIDNYAGKNVVWGHGGVRRYDVDVIDA